MGGTLLLADDSITIQKVVELTFAETEHKVVTVGSGRELLSRLAEVNPDLILCDVIMPDVSGYEVCQELKSDPGTLHLPVILLTGTFEPFDRDRALAAGCDAIVTKPFEAEELIRTVDDLLAGRTTTEAPEPLSAPTTPEVEEIEFTSSGLGRPAPDVSEPVPSEEIVPPDEGAAAAPPEPDFAEPIGGEDFEFAEESAPPVPTSEPLDDPFAAVAAPVEAAPEEALPPAMPDEAAAPLAPEEALPPVEPEEAAPLPEVSAASPQAAAPPMEETAPGETGFREEEAPAPPEKEEAPAAQRPAAAVGAGNGDAIRLSDEDLERLARKVLELATPLLERVAWEVVPDMAEMLVRTRIRELEEAAER